MNWGWGETLTHYCWCRYDNCGYVTNDFDNENDPYDDIVEHIKSVHGGSEDD